MVPPKKIITTMPISIQTRDALAQFALLILVLPLNDQTKSIIKLTNGITMINIVKIQSPTVTGRFL